MKNGIRIFLVCVLLVGGTAIFAHWTLEQFNKELDNLSASSLAFAKMPPTSFSDKTRKEQIPTTPVEPVPEPVPEITSATSTDLNLSFAFPKKNSELYRGCTYQVSFQSSAAIGAVITALVDAGAKETVEPLESGLAEKYEIEPDSQSFDWKVGAVWMGEYYIKASDKNGVDVRSDIFKIRNMPTGTSASQREKICKESNG